MRCIVFNLFSNYIEPKFKNFFQYLVQLNKVTFLSDKFLNESPVESLFYVCDFISLVLQLNLTDQINRTYVLLIIDNFYCI